MGRTAATRAALLARTCGAGARRADSQKGATRRAARAPLASTEAAPRVCARAPARASSPDRLAIAPHGFAGAPPACPDERARSCRRESATARSQGHARDLARAREADVGARDVGDRGGGGGAVRVRGRRSRARPADAPSACAGGGTRLSWPLPRRRYNVQSLAAPTLGLLCCPLGGPVMGRSSALMRFRLEPLPPAAPGATRGNTAAAASRGKPRPRPRGAVLGYISRASSNRTLRTTRGTCPSSARV